MAARRKRCKVYVEVEQMVGYRDGKRRPHYQRMRCENKIKRGTPFCEEHFHTHKLVEVKCNGEAHSNPFIDNCGICMPHWGHYPVAVLKEEEGKPWEGAWE